MLSKTSLSSLLALSIASLSASSFAATYGNTAIVSSSGGDYTSPIAAMADVATWCGVPSAANRCQLKLTAGTFDLGGGRVDMQDYVDVTGAGQDSTILQTTGNSSSSAAGVVRGASNSELSNLTLHSTGGSSFNLGLSLNGGVNTHVRRISVVVDGYTSSQAYGIAIAKASPVIEDSTVSLNTNGFNYGISIYHSTSFSIIKNVSVDVQGSGTNLGVSHSFSNNAKMYDSVITAHGGNDNEGIRNQQAAPALFNVRATGYGSSGSAASIGILNLGASNYPTVIQNSRFEAYGSSQNWGSKDVNSGYGPNSVIENSVFKGATAAIQNQNGTVTVTNSKLSGGVILISGTVTCGGVTDAEGTFFASTCP